MKKYIALATLMSAATLVHAQDDATGACEKMKSFAMDGVVIDSAVLERSGKFTTSVGPVLSNLPAFCRVVGHATPTPQSNIGFEVWLPEKNWSGRYVQVGSGGLAGFIFDQLLGEMVERGHATASTDNGHTGSAIDGRWAIGQPEKFATSREKLGALMDASKTDLSEFRRRGGKLLQYHGLLDDSIPPAMSTTYYDHVAKQSGGVGKTQDFYRLFLAPGVLHCGFGPGPNAFGNLGPSAPADAGHDTLLAVQKWVEEGVAPKQIVATKYVEDDPAKGVTMTRPLCPYPQTADWDGKGKIEASEGFSCK